MQLKSTDLYILPILVLSRPTLADAWPHAVAEDDGSPLPVEAWENP